MVDVKQAIANAKAYAAEMLGQTQLLLEEVRSTDDHFEVTLSFPQRGRTLPGPLPVEEYRRGPLEYKTFEVKKDTGEVVAMSMRQIA